MTVLLLLAIAVLILTAGLFSGSETAVTSANRVALRQAADGGDPGAERALALATHLPRVLATTLVGTNIAISAATSLSNIFISGIDAVSPAARDLVTTLTLTPVLLVFAEMIPKSVGRGYANAITCRLGRPLAWFERIFRPFILLNTAVASWVARTARLEDAHNGHRVSRDDLCDVAAIAAEQGLLPDPLADMFRRLFELGHHPVADILVPLQRVESLPVTATLADVEERTRNSGYSRFPVYEETPDNIIGVIDIRDVLSRTGPPNAAAGQLQCGIRELVRANLAFVAAETPVADLVWQLHHQRLPMAAVQREDGQVIGIVGADDLFGWILAEPASTATHDPGQEQASCHE